MAYHAFAHWYDALNSAADYERLAEAVLQELREHGVDEGIVADLGCGTGELCLRLASAGYDMLAVDASPEMLSVLREKMDAQGREGILLLCQDLSELDLYGTIRAAVSSFDTLNHLGRAALESAVKRVALFTEPGGLFVFDMNTPYKHEKVLANRQFEVETEDGRVCLWDNRYDADTASTAITVQGIEDGQTVFCEAFVEYAYALPEIERLLGETGWRLVKVQDGETFCALHAESQRMMITAQKI